MYLFYFFALLSLLQLLMFRMPGLLLILVIAYAIYSYVQSRRLRQGVGSAYGAQGHRYTQENTSASQRKSSEDIIDVEYTEHEL